MVLSNLIKHLIFTDQPNYVIECGTITFRKLNLKVEYPPPYEHLVSNFKKSNNAIKKTIELVNWNLFFSNNSVHEQVTIFNQTLIFFEITYQTN